MKIVITGGAGYLGSIMCQHMLAKGYEVTVVDNLMYCQTTLFQYCADKRFNFIRGDARDEALMRKAIADADVIIPLAAIVGAPACDMDPWAARSINFEAERMVNSLRSKSQRNVYPVTNSGYGTKSGDVFCTEETPMEPISRYGIDKVEAEKVLLDSGDAITLRLATVYGMSPRMRLDLLVNHFTYAAVTDGYLVLFEKDFKRNFVHIRDVADGFIFSIENYDKMKGKSYNLGLDAANMSKEELANKVKDQVPNFVITYSQLRSDPDKRNYVVSNDRLRKAGFEASRSIEEGIRELLVGYRMMPRSEFKNI